MTTTLHALCIAANDPAALARFWGGVLGWDVDPTDGLVLVPRDDTGFLIRFVTTAEPKTVPNQIHFDVTSTSLADQEATVARVLQLGGSHLDIGQGPDVDHVVLGDPEGNEMCIIPPGNSFLAGCPFIGALSSDGTQAVGYFWSAALDWPLVWDQDEETAIRSPQGGSKISWGGPPVREKTGPNRFTLELAPASGSDQESEVARLIDLGASRIDVEPHRPGVVAMADPDGNEFWIS